MCQSKKSIMKILKRFQFVVLMVLFIPILGIAQTPVPLGAATSFVLFSIPGPVGNTGTSFITGDVGSSAGSSTGFGNINGQFKDGAAQNTAVTAIVGADYLSLGTQTTTGVLPVLFGNGLTLSPGVYEQTIASTLAGELVLDGLNLANPCFVFKISAAMSADPGASIKLINGAQACNIFWKIDGALSTGTGVTLKGNFFCDGAIGLATGCKLEGRAYSISGAIQVSSTVATAPLGCGVPALIGPIAPPLGAAACFSLLTGVGELTNTGISHIGGHVGTNNGPVTGFNPLFVDSIHYVNDPMTAAGTGAIGTLYTTLTGMQCDIDLFDPAQFGHSQVLTPHVYCMGSATHLVDTIFLDAQGSPDAVFVFISSGAFTTATFANIVLRGGAKSSNVFWAVNGLVTILSSSNFVGTIVATGAITLDGVNLDGRAYSQTGAIIVSDLDLVSPSVSNPVIITGGNIICSGDSLQLTATISANYLWSNGDTTQSIMVYTGGNYSVTASNECGNSTTSNTISVTVNPIYILNPNVAICQGDSIFLAGQFRKIQGIYTDSLSSATGCDSVINTNLSVNPKFISNNNVAICQGDSIFLAGQFRKIQGLYADTLISQFTCDSIINTNLTVHPTFITNRNATICEGDSIMIGGFFRKLAGIYTENFSTQFTCDSVVNTNLLIDPKPHAFAGNDTTIVSGQVVLLGDPEVLGNTYSWLPITGLDQANTAQVNASPSDLTTYILTVVNTITGCVNIDTVMITISPNTDVEFFNGFSPNADGINDFWRIPILSLFQTNTVSIMSRWGNEIWSTTNYDNLSNVWTGKNMNGDDMPDGTYYYHINYSGVDKQGWVFIKR